MDRGNEPTPAGEVYRVQIAELEEMEERLRAMTRAAVSSASANNTHTHG